MDITRLYILIFFYIKKISRSIWNSPAHFRKKGKEPIIYVVFRKNMLYTPIFFEQAKTFQRAMLAHLPGIFPSAGGPPVIFFLFVCKKCLYVLFCINASICIGRETLFLPYLKWKLVISYSYFSIGKIIVLAFYTI